jgi:arginyl-tRNA synthetase
MSALSIYTSNSQIPCTLNNKFPLSKARDDRKISYITGIALKLSKYENLPAMEIANAIACDLSTKFPEVLNVWIASPGWVYLEVAHTVVAAWLQRLVGPELFERAAVRKTEQLSTIADSQFSVFYVQYTHARCCSLMRLAQQEKLLLAIDAIPWLNEKQKLRLNHDAELRLLGKLVQATDEESECSVFGNEFRWEKRAFCLSQAFENFWCSCRIWDEVKVSSPELAQARLGLVMATQSVLRFLLEEKLNTFAPWEL